MNLYWKSNERATPNYIDTNKINWYNGYINKFNNKGRKTVNWGNMKGEN